MNVSCVFVPQTRNKVSGDIIPLSRLNWGSDFTVNIVFSSIFDAIQSFTR